MKEIWLFLLKLLVFCVSYYFYVGLYCKLQSTYPYWKRGYTWNGNNNHIFIYYFFKINLRECF